MAYSKTLAPAVQIDGKLSTADQCSLSEAGQITSDPHKRSGVRRAAAHGARGLKRIPSTPGIRRPLAGRK